MLVDVGEGIDNYKKAQSGDLSQGHNFMRMTYSVETSSCIGTGESGYGDCLRCCIRLCNRQCI